MLRFQEAIRFLLNHHSVLKNGVGLIGMSLGAELAAVIASHFQNVSDSYFFPAESWNTQWESGSPATKERFWSYFIYANFISG